ncbi:MAG: DUF362 domain-containing protein [Polyangiaceae bacterium]|nr:DUF362 domain-containing protein [Polyangiaceae bacterium]
MSERESKNLSRRNFLGISVGAVVAAGIGCSDESGTASETGGQPGSGGAGTGGGTTGTTGGAAATGGIPGSTGGTTSATTGGTTSATTGGTTSPTTGGTTGATTGGTTSATTGGTGGDTGGTSGTTGGTTGDTGGRSSGGRSGGRGGTTGDTGGTTSDAGGTTATTGGTTGDTGGTSASTGGEQGTGGGGSTGDGLVTLVRATDYKQAVRDACFALMPDLAGKTVVIRPNLIEARPDGTTSAPVIAGVALAAKDKGASSILICEDAFAASDIAATMDTLGITEALADTGATPANLKGTDATNARPAGADAWGSGIDFYDIVKNADYVVNVPKCKTHGIARFSLGLKAWFGSVKRPGDLHTSIANKCAEAHLVRQEDLVVVDATRCMTTGGPTQGGTMAESNVVIVSKDAIAAEVTAVAVLRLNGAGLKVPWTEDQIARAMALKYPGWLSAQTDFAYNLAGISQADADAIKAKRDA